jgi:O-antigen/teichoic acid export membrane protein
VARHSRLKIADLRGHTARGVLVNGAFELGLVAVSALRGVAVAAFLSRSDYGVWGLLGLALWTALGLKAQFGVNDKYVQQDDEDQEQAFQRAFTVELTFAAAMAPVVVAVVVVFATISQDWAVLAPGLALLALLPSTALQFPLWAFYRDMDYRRQRTLQAIDPVGGTVITLALAIAGAGYWSLVIGLLVGSWGAAAAALRASPYRLRLRHDTVTLRQYIGFSAPMVIAGVATLATFQVIFLVGNGPLGLAGLGAFTLVGNLVQFTDQADTIVTSTLYPAVCAVRDRTSVLAEAFVKSNRLALMWAVPFGIGLALFAPDLVRFVLGRRWLSAVTLLQIMGIVTAVHHVGFNWYAFFKARGSTWPLAIVAIVNAAIVIGAGIPLMYRHGLVGLGIAFALAEAFALVVRAVLLIRFFGQFAIVSHLTRAFAPTLVAATVVLGLRALTGSEQSLAAAAMLAVFSAVVVIATTALERPLLGEAVGYLTRRRPELA